MYLTKVFQSLDDEIMPWDIETGKQIIAEKTGLNFSPSDDSRITDIENTGLIWEPRQNTLEEEAYLTEMYKNLDRTLPNSYDSRSLGIITPIRNQKKRATCVAFATGVALETGLKKAVKGAKLSKIALVCFDALKIYLSQKIYSSQKCFDGNRFEGCLVVVLECFRPLVSSKLGPSHNI